METPGQGRRPDQYESSAKIVFYSVFMIILIIVILFIYNLIGL